MTVLEQEKRASTEGIPQCEQPKCSEGVVQGWPTEHRASESEHLCWGWGTSWGCVLQPEQIEGIHA